MQPPMNADERRLDLDGITEKIIGCAQQVSNVLGCGFLEKVYENALVLELRVPNIMKRAMRCHDFGSGLEESPAA